MAQPGVKIPFFLRGLLLGKKKAPVSQFTGAIWWFTRAICNIMILHPILNTSSHDTLSDSPPPHHSTAPPRTRKKQCFNNLLLSKTLVKNNPWIRYPLITNSPDTDIKWPPSLLHCSVWHPCNPLSDFIQIRSRWHYTSLFSFIVHDFLLVTIKWLNWPNMHDPGKDQCFKD